jgi:Fe-Mn family superoxide dismutase
MPNINQNTAPAKSKEQQSGFNRRKFLGITAAGATAAALGEIGFVSKASADSEHWEHWDAISSTPVTPELAPLPWVDTALEPTITAKTLSFHYGKHHKGYLANLNTLLASTDPAVKEITDKLQGKTLEQIIIATFHNKNPSAVSAYRNAAQVYNHNFYWNSLKPNGGDLPTGKIAELINGSFGDYATFKTKLIDTAVAQFGTGWAWVVVNRKNKLRILATGDADTPLTLRGLTPLLTIDVWEHAYYLDYQNARKTYLTAVVDKLLNWDFANQNLA